MVLLYFLGIIGLVFILALFGALLYLVYLPFKKRLKKSGKLNDKLDRKINRTYIVVLCLAGVAFVCIVTHKTPSDKRLENASDVKLPKKCSVIKDEYHDMLQDYAIIYEIQFDDEATTELINEIKASKYYNPNPNSLFFDSLYFKVDDVKAIWSRYKNGYYFIREDDGGRHSFSIKLDTLTNILSYDEGSD